MGVLQYSWTKCLKSQKAEEKGGGVRGKTEMKIGQCYLISKKQRFSDSGLSGSMICSLNSKCVGRVKLTFTGG